MDLEVLTRRMKHLNNTLNHFWSRWRSEYLNELREVHYHSVRKISEKKQPGLSVGEVVIVHDEHLPRGLWKLGRIQETIEGRDGQIRGATIKMAKRDRQQDLLRRPIQLLYPLELCCPNPPEIGTEGLEESPENVSPPGIGSTEGDENTENLHSEVPQEFRRRSRRSTARRADERRKACMHQLQDI